MFDKQITVGYWHGKYAPLTEVDLKVLDVVNFSFSQIVRDTEGKWDIQGRLENLEAFKPLKEQGVKFCLSLGGWHDDRSFWNTYALAAATKESRKEVAEAILNCLVKYDLDGIDMDWEYPTRKDRKNYTLLMKQIRKTLKAANKDYLVTAAIPAGNWIGENFDLKGLNSCLDYFYIMSYDLDDGMACDHLSSLHDAKEAIEFYLKSGVDREKLVIGSAFYGRVYEGVPEENNGLGAMSTNKDEINYHDIKKDYLSRIGKDVVKVYDEKAEAYFLYDKTNKVYITYEDTESVTDKWNYVVESKIGGIMYWSYQNDLTNTLMTALCKAQNK